MYCLTKMFLLVSISLHVNNKINTYVDARLSLTAKTGDMKATDG